MTAVCFGGRAAIGQLILVIGAALTASCWLLHQLSTTEAKYRWTGSEWLWGLGIAVGVVQIVPMPREWILAISPELARLTAASSPGTSSSFGIQVWNQLSLAPWETVSGLATFVAYALLFLVLVQRVQTVDDIERLTIGAGIAAVVMAVFAQLQYATSNGQFYWCYEHPYMTTNFRPNGCFTNRNHLAQFLAMGLGPLIWGMLRPASPRTTESGQVSWSSAGGLIPLLVGSAGLGITVLTALATLSRGGLLALAVSAAVCIGVFWRLGLVSIKAYLGLLGVFSVVGVIFSLAGTEASLEARLEGGVGREHIWAANIAVANDFPIFGTGVGTHADAHQLHLDVPDDGHEYTHAECGYLQVLSETGYIGVGVAGLFILTSFWWCYAALRNPDTRLTSIVAAVLASLMANVTHAAVDFFWYTPSCILMLALQLACACRLNQMTREALGRRVWAWRLPRAVSVLVLGGVCAVAAWMVYVKMPSALAEPHKMRYITLSLVGRTSTTDDEEFLEVQTGRRQEAVKAVRFDPHDSRLLELAGIAYLAWFDERQKSAENPMSLTQLRDVVKASSFESPTALREWLDRAVGKNIKLLRIAARYFQRSVRESPLRAIAYIHLSELGFLNSEDAATEASFLKQAITLRPHDPEILFQMGKNVLMSGDVEAAMRYWREAFHRSTKLRDVITLLLVEQVSSEFILTHLQPEWSALSPLAQAFARVGRVDEAQPIWQKCVNEGIPRLKTELTIKDREQTLLAIREAYVALGEPDRAIAVLSRAQRQMRYSVPVCRQLGLDLFAAGRYAEAADHLQWCAARCPDDKALLRAAEKSVKESLRSSGEKQASDAPPDSIIR